MKRFLRLTIGKKMLLGFFPLSVLVFAIAAFTLARLDRVTRINQSIIENDLIARPGIWPCPEL